MTNEVNKTLIPELKQRLPADVFAHIRRMIMYGSCVRRDTTEDFYLDFVALVN
jgi:hypothetical protein